MKKPVLKTIVRAFYMFLNWVFYLVVITWVKRYKAYTFQFKSILTKFLFNKKRPKRHEGRFFLVFRVIKLFNSVFNVSAPVRVAP